MTQQAPLCIVVPTLNEGQTLLPCLHAVQGLRQHGVYVVVADGGSADETTSVATGLVDLVVTAPRGRASQMNAGADAGLRSCGAQALLFLHADTLLPPNADRLVAAALAQGVWGRFDVHIDGHASFLRMIAFLINLRSRLTGIATGDQALFVRSDMFRALGGFAPIALMEDIEMSSRLKAHGLPVCLKEKVTTSGRRWEKHGLIRTVVSMWWLRALYFLGADTHCLAWRYGYRPRAAAAIAIMAKAPIPGLAKTRLIPAMGPVQAARVQRRFICATVALARFASTGEVVLWCAPQAQHRFFRALAQRHAVQCLQQSQGDLGDRMQVALETHFSASPHVPLIILGTDCPVLTAQHLQNVADALQTHDVAAIPAEDGGYVLIGFSKPVAGVFRSVSWSTSLVMAQTRQRIQDAEASYIEFPPLWDVDEPADWQRWVLLSGK